MIMRICFYKSKASNDLKVKIIISISHDGECFKIALARFFKTNIFMFEKYLGLGAGYPCFVISIAMIGVCTAVIGDVAGHLGCFIYLKDSVNAIAFVALGTSVPGTKICCLKKGNVHLGFC